MAKSSGNQELAATILNDSSLGAYPDSVDSYIPKDKISLGIGFKLENAEKHEDKVPIVNENSSREDPLPEKRDQHFDKLSPGNSEDANSHWDIDSNDSEEQSDQVQISPGGASPDFQQHEGGQQGITREVTFNEVIDYAYKVREVFLEMGLYLDIWFILNG